MDSVSLRNRPLEQEATLPDGGTVRVRVGVPDDTYIAKRELDTVTVELYGNGEHLAAVSTVLDADQDSAARALLQEIVSGLESGELVPTAGAIEPLADTLRP
jgi:arginine utilization protein RocB